jgi:hypothetical protein
VSVPGQLADVAQPVHDPSKQVMLDPQEIPFDLFICDGVPELHTPVVQAVSGGRLVLSLTSFVFPAPSHCVFLQYPGLESVTAVPFAT